MTQDEKLKLAKLLEEKERRDTYAKFDDLFPEVGKYPRSEYPKHIEFMNAGSKFSERAFIAGNRTGKTVAGGYEMVCHLTGLYPPWWEGKKFQRAVSAWAASISYEVTRDVMQELLCGPIEAIGTGFIPQKLIIGSPTRKSGMTQVIDTIQVKHSSGEVSKLQFKAYDQKRDKFQGAKKQVVWLDEEPRDQGIYTECITRTGGDTGKEGIIYCTFTPLLGLSSVALSFLPSGQFPASGTSEEFPNKFVQGVGWDDVPHLSEKWKRETMATYPEHERLARTQGIPSLGSGSIYPYPEEKVVVTPFDIPAYWPRAYGMDVGWNKTAAVWGALDPESGTVYLYSEYYAGKAEPAVHAAGIKARGKWIIGAIDPSANKSNEIDGRRMMSMYQDEGLDVFKAENSREAGLLMVAQYLAADKLKIFSSLHSLLAEYRVYRRDENGDVVKNLDHLMDSMRYLIMSGMRMAQVNPEEIDFQKELRADIRASGDDGSGTITGY